MSKDLGVTKREDNYAEWYNDLVKKADLADNSVVRGCMVIKPHGYAIWEHMRDALDAMFKETGHVNAYFPLLIPKSFLSKEAEHVDGFAKECAIVTHHRLMNSPDGKGVVVDPDAKLEEEFVIRPTSETIIWHSYKNWIQSYRDLPLLINQWANVMRWELRTRLFLRTAEFLWQEGHTAHATYDEAEEEARTILGVYKRFAEEWMAVPVIDGIKSDGEKFAGADHTYTIEAMTQDFRAIQAGTSHHLGQKFAKAFDVTFQNQDGKLEHVYATSWGVSTRLIGALIMAHSDDNGLVCPPRLAPIQIVIVPIGRGEDRETVLHTAENLARDLRTRSFANKPIRVHIDKREKESPGFKFNHWELRGVCLRVEIGPRDLAEGKATIARRDTGEKITVPIPDLAQTLADELPTFHQRVYDKALALREANTKRIDTWEEFQAAFQGEGGGGFVLAHWDGTQATEDAISAHTKATIRCIPIQPLHPDDENPGQCVYSGQPSQKRVVFAKAY